jgi:extracellular factor (EF) 3-hydroxypalmitic acid methyl ester biosynthesis protein
MTPPNPLSARFVNTVEMTIAVLQHAVAPSHWPQLFDSLDTLLQETCAVLPEQSHRTQQHVEYWRSRLHPYFLQAPLFWRAFKKPLGYAGDYETMNMLYRNTPEGETELGRALHQYMNSWRSADAVRSRRRWIVQQIRQHARGKRDVYRIASVASGPAVEMQDLVRETALADRTELTCIDQDAASLACAQQGLERAQAETCRTAKTRFVQTSAKRIMMSGTQRLEIAPQDFIYSLGLYDYLSERATRLLTAALYGLLAPGGRLVVGNFAPNTECFVMNLICDWSLTYRDEDEVRGFAQELPSDARISVAREPVGLNLFAVIDKPH